MEKKEILIKNFPSTLARTQFSFLFVSHRQQKKSVVNMAKNKRILFMSFSYTWKKYLHYTIIPQTKAFFSIYLFIYWNIACSSVFQLFILNILDDESLG
jgi:hypothetical protein